MKYKKFWLALFPFALTFLIGILTADFSDFIFSSTKNLEETFSSSENLNSQNEKNNLPKIRESKDCVPVDSNLTYQQLKNTDENKVLNKGKNSPVLINELIDLHRQEIELTKKLEDKKLSEKAKSELTNQLEAIEKSIKIYNNIVINGKSPAIYLLYVGKCSEK